MASTTPTTNTTTALATSIDMDMEKNISSDENVEVTSQRAQWLRAAVLGANDGLLSTASLIVGVGAVKTDPHTVLLAGLAGLIGGAFSMAAGEFVSVYSQYEIELTQLKRAIRDQNGSTDNKTNCRAGTADVDNNMNDDEYYMKKLRELPSPFKAAVASAVSFAVGAAVPLVATVGLFQKAYEVRLGVVIGAVSLALVVFGWLGAVLGRSSPLKPAVRVLIGGWIAMAITYGLTKIVGSSAAAI